jgi:hypothetical protein
MSKFVRRTLLRVLLLQLLTGKAPPARRLRLVLRHSAEPGLKPAA